jgi:phage gp36-like protein
LDHSIGLPLTPAAGDWPGGRWAARSEITINKGMSAWNVVTVDNVLEEFNSQERTAYDASKGSDDFQAILDRVIKKARGAVIAAGKTAGPVGTVPSSLEGEVIAIARWRFLLALPSAEGLLSDGRKDAHKEGLKTLKEVSKGEQPVEVPDAGTASADAASISATQLVTRQRREATREKMNGL